MIKKPTYAMYIVALLFSGCASQVKDDSSKVVSMQLIDRNGFAETISSKERLHLFQKTDFSAPQPYKKILRVFGKNGEGKSGSKISSYHDNGQLHEYLEVVDGRAHGLFREYYPNGQIKIEGRVIEGVADINDTAKASWQFDQKTFVWEEDGSHIAEFTYDRGFLEGTSLYYHPNGSLKKSIQYHHNELEGEYIEYDSMARVIRKAFFEKGVQEGISIGYWREDATQEQLSFLEEYKKGILQRGSYYNPAGKLVAEVVEGEGKQAIFKEDKLYSLIHYRDGVPEGLVEVFTEEGDLKQTYHVKEGKKSGEEIEYYSLKTSKEKLQPKLSLHWQEDLLQGMVKTWYKEGGLESQREMDRNKKQGLSFAWYPNGDLMLMEEYEQDRLKKGSYFQQGHNQPTSKVEDGSGTVTLFTPEGHFLKKIPYANGSPV